MIILRRGWPQTCCGAEDDSELPILLLPTPECLANRRVPPDKVYVVLGMEQGLRPHTC